MVEKMAFVSESYDGVSTPISEKELRARLFGNYKDSDLVISDMIEHGTVFRTSFSSYKYVEDGDST